MTRPTYLGSKWTSEPGNYPTNSENHLFSFIDDASTLFVNDRSGDGLTNSVPGCFHQGLGSHCHIWSHNPGVLLGGLPEV
jgi:hypothetical protein